MSNHCRTIGFFQSEVGVHPKALDRSGANLRRAGMAPPRKRGPAPDITTAAAIDLLIGSILAPRNSKVVETVEALRGQHMTSAHFNPLSFDTAAEDRARAAFKSVRDIGIHLASPLNVSAVLGAVVDSMRSGEFDRWAAGEGHVIVDFHGEGRGTLIYFDRPVANEAAVFAFGMNKETLRPPVERMVRLNEKVLRGLAAALGPLPASLPETAIPPPPY